MNCRATIGSSPTPLGRGFTLIELLVVVALIGFLAALLCPGLARARGQSRLTCCKCNLHQLGLALVMYLHDSESTYPYVLSLPDSNSRGISFWFDAMAFYLSDTPWGKGVLGCPAYRGIVYAGETRANERGQVTAMYCPCGSYAYNAKGRRPSAPSSRGPISSGLGFCVCGGQPMEQPIREAEVKAPAELYAFGDAPLFTAPWGAVAALGLGGAADYNSVLGDDVGVEMASHGFIFTMVLADTHVESLKTEVLLGTNVVSRARWNHDHLP